MLVTVICWLCGENCPVEKVIFHKFEHPFSFIFPLFFCLGHLRVSGPQVIILLKNEVLQMDAQLLPFLSEKKILNLL